MNAIDRSDLEALKELMLSKFDALEKAETARAIQVEKALTAATTAADRAVTEAKNAADRVSGTLTKRIEHLESGGAPFASRLDSSLQELKVNVDDLMTDAVRTKVLEALEKSRSDEAKSQKRTSKAALATGGGAMIIAVIRFFVERS